MIDDDALQLRRPKWDAALLVCKDCGKRKRAPKDVKPKKVASMLRSLTKREASRPRIVMTGCLGLCPKEATAVAVVGRSLQSTIVAISRADQLGALTSAVFVPAVTLPLETRPSDDR